MPLGTGYGSQNSTGMAKWRLSRPSRPAAGEREDSRLAELYRLHCADSRRADILFQCSDNTWQAYNRWPGDYSMYTDPRHPWAPAVAASFDRPYGKYAQIFDHPLSIGSGEFLLWEFPLCYWLESHGYDVTYC